MFTLLLSLEILAVFFFSPRRPRFLVGLFCVCSDVPYGDSGRHIADLAVLKRLQHNSPIQSLSENCRIHLMLSLTVELSPLLLTQLGLKLHAKKLFWSWRNSTQIWKITKGTPLRRVSGEMQKALLEQRRAFCSSRLLTQDVNCIRCLRSACWEQTDCVPFSAHSSLLF